MRIHEQSITSRERPYIIAEISANHGGDFGQAQRAIDAAAQAGADAVKFQTLSPETLVHTMPLLTGYDLEHDTWARRLGVTTLRELFAHSGLPRAWHRELRDHAWAVGLAFLSTPFSVDDARFLVEEIGVPALKIASGDLTFTPLLEYAASTKLPIILSTGCATLEEIDGVFQILSRQYTVLCHCVSAYPHGAAHANLRGITTLRKTFGLPVGYSDHTTDVDMIPAMAVALGVTVYEKHFKGPGETRTPDTDHSIDTGAFAAMVQRIRQASAAAGSGDRSRVHPLEHHERLWTRRSPVDWLRPTNEARAGRWE